MTLGRDSLTSEVIHWIERCLGVGWSVVGATRLGGATGPWLLQTRGQRGDESVVLREGDPAVTSERLRFGVEVSALKAAADLGIAAPRLMGHDLSGDDASRLAILSTRLPGENVIPRQPSRERLLALGRAAASLGCAAPRDTGLPMRQRPLSDLDFAGDRAAGDTTDLLDEADAFIASNLPSDTPNVLVHGDCWQGNTLWQGDQFTGFVDWDAAGIGQPGLDLGSLRFDVAMYFGLDAPAVVAQGWSDAGGPLIDQLGYWDVLAALSSPADLSSWMPTITGPGRPDLDVQTVTARRDAFIRAALRNDGR